ncbi:MAG: SDR family NAD(P)-dependent oxidoreductase [Alphaproteobacteria bacterium]|nr:SDR family NAD(P)-dependent oxidoreductase [Alphaproteobacteria bacterium]
MKSFNLDLTGKRALVTGSTQGIGFATARGLAEMGAVVAINGRTAEAVDGAIIRLSDQVPDARLVAAPGNLSAAEGCAAVIEAAGELDVLVNNMGIYSPKPWDDITDAEWQEIFDVNVMSGVRLSRHYLSPMIGKDWGRVIFVSSESAIFIPPEMVHYGFSKMAQLAVARGCAELTKGTGVTVNSVLPGPTDVDRSAERLAKRAEQQGITVEALRKATFDVRRTSSLLQRYATADEVASMICYLCSPAASASNGAAFRCDGGIVKTPY